MLIISFVLLMVVRMIYKIYEPFANFVTLRDTHMVKKAETGFRNILSPLQCMVLVYCKQNRDFGQIQEHLDNIEVKFLHRFLENLINGGWLSFNDIDSTFNITTDGRIKLREAFDFMDRLRES